MSSFLNFLVSIRKVTFWILVPTQEEIQVMDFFVRHINNQALPFPKITEAQEDLEIVLNQDLREEERTHLKYFLLNHFALLEFQAMLYHLTTKKSV